MPTFTFLLLSLGSRWIARGGLRLRDAARLAGLLVLGCAAVSAWASPPATQPAAAPAAVFASPGSQAGARVAQALYRCPGPLFTNDLTALQARTLGCTLAQRAGWSQAQVPAEQALAQPLTLAGAQSRPTNTPSPTNTPTPSSAQPAALPTLSTIIQAPHTPSTRTQAHSGANVATAAAASDTARSAPWAAPASPLPAPVPSAARAMAPSEPGSEALRQRQRDRHARDIVLAELASTQARIQVLSARPRVSADQESALQRLQRDEDALRRELARRPG